MMLGGRVAQRSNGRTDRIQVTAGRGGARRSMVLQHVERGPAAGVYATISSSTCSVDAAETIARRVPKSELVIFEQSGHLPFVEEQELYIEAVRNFLDRRSS
jgi:pimeloyl-ACP methyl ester carboxylesterase